MKRKYLLEISVESLEGAMAAERGGADRIELCAELSVGGVTPSAELMSAAREQVHLPIFAMIRPRGGDFVYSDEEFAEMKRAILRTKEAGMHGVVLGILTQGRGVDIERTSELIEVAWPLPVTFHRAFDDAADLRRALEDVVQTRAARILTSGGAAGALAGAAVLAELVAADDDRIIIVPGAGTNAENVAEVLQKTGASEIHSGLSSAMPYGSRDYKKFEAEVRKLAELVASVS
jgi:copper homeostasis protein